MEPAHGDTPGAVITFESILILLLAAVLLAAVLLPKIRKGRDEAFQE